MKNKRILTAGLACLVLGLIPAAKANIVTYTEDFGGPSAYTTYMGTINIPQISLSPGQIIQSITFMTSASLSGNVTLEAPSQSETINSPITFFGNIFSYLSDDTVVSDTQSANGSQTLVSASHFSPFTFNQGQLYSYTVTGLAESQSYTFTPTSTGDVDGDPVSGATIISEFTGSGNVPVNVDGASEISSTLSGNLDLASTVTVAGSIEIEYDIVPEPATWISAALLFGVVGFGTGRTLWRKSFKLAA